MPRRHALCLAAILACGFVPSPGHPAAGTDATSTPDQHAIEGRWRAVTIEIDGNRVGTDDTRTIVLDHGRDGEWKLLIDGSEEARGTSTLDPSVTPKTIDFATTKGTNAGERTYGIYEVTRASLKICTAGAGRPRPADFSAPAGSDRLLAVFELVDD